MPRLGGDNNSINNNSSATGGGILHSPPPPLLSASGGGVGGRTQVVSHSPGVFSVPATNHTTMTAPGAAASSTTMNHMDDYDNCLRRDTESLFGPIDDEGSSSSLLRGGGVASGGGGGGLLQHPKIRVPPLRFSGGGGGGASAGATLGGVIKINHNVLGSGSGQQAPATTTTPVMGNAVAGGSFTFGSASVQRSGDVHNISAAGTGGGHATGGGVGLHGSSRFLPLSTNVPSPHFGRNIQALHVGSSTNSGSNSAVGGSSGVLAPTHASTTFQSGSVAAYHSATHHISSLTGVHSPSSLSAHPFSQPGTPGGVVTSQQQQQQQQQSQSNNNSKPNPHTFPASGHQLHSNSGASPPLGMPPLPPPSPGAAAGAAHSNGFPFSMEEIADNDQVMTQMAHAVARHSGLREPSTVAECQELLETFMREMQRPPSGVPQTVSGGNPSPRALGGSTSAVDGRATIVAELQWADGRDAPVPHHIGQQHSASAGGGDWGTNSWPHRSAQPIDLAIVNGALTPSSSGHLTRNSGTAPGSSNTTPRTSSTILRGSPATHALLAGVSPRGALPVNNSHNPYSYHRFQDPNGSASTRPEEDTNSYSQPKPRRSAPKIHPAAQRSPTVNLHSSNGSTATTAAVAATDVIDPAAVAAVATSYATIASGAAAAQRNNNSNGGGNNNNAAATPSQSVGSSQRTTSQYHHGHPSSSHPTSSNNHSHGHQHSHTGGGGGGGFALSLGHPAATNTTIVASALGAGAGNMSVGNITVSTSSNGSVGICPPQHHHHVSNRPGAVRPGGVPEAIPSRGKKVERSASSAFSECSTSSTTDLVAPHEQSSSHLAPPSTSSRHQSKRV